MAPSASICYGFALLLTPTHRPPQSRGRALCDIHNAWDYCLEVVTLNLDNMVTIWHKTVLYQTIPTIHVHYRNPPTKTHKQYIEI